MSNNQEEKTVHQLWRELGITHANFEFTCGGDSMNDTTLTLIGKDGEQISNREIEDYIDNEVYNRVEFYVNSDGHYQGEMGTVEITLDESGEDFDYCKSSQSEWSESYQSRTWVELDEKEAEFIKDKVLNINGDSDNATINFNRDLILSDDEEATMNAIEEKVIDQLREYSPEQDEGELEEWFSFTTNDEGQDIKVVGNKVEVTINNQVTVWKDE